MSAECRYGDDVNAFLAGELPLVEQVEFSAHLEGCDACRAAVNSSRRVIARLRAMPEVKCERDLAPLIVARLHTPEEMPRPAMWRRVAAVAAVFAIIAGGSEAWQRNSSPAIVAAPGAAAAESSASASRALDWLVRVQESDGSWSVERWGGQRNYTPALTALPLLALENADDHTPARDAAAARAASSLLHLQNADGSFGPAFQGAPYNRSIATLALLHAWQRNPDTVPKAALDSALAVLVAQQTPEGGWGYPYSRFADRSITQWHVQALETAASLGWKNARPAAERGLRWLASHSKSLPDSDEPADSTSAILARATARPADADGTLDFYQVYFTTAALKHEGAPDARERLARLQSELLHHQVIDGSERGSWPPDDQWGRAGGRLYSTALASLSLQSQ